jgi:hypothetical protein
MIEISNRHFDLLIEKLPRLVGYGKERASTYYTPPTRRLAANMAASWATEKEKKYNK